MSPKIFLLDFLAAPEISLGHSCFTSLFSSFFVLIGCTFISSLTFSKKEDSRNSFAPISHGSMQIRNLHLTFLSFVLRKVLGSSLESPLKSTGSHTKRKLNSSSYSLKGTRKLSQALYHSFMSGSMSIFPLKKHKLGKGSNYSPLRIHVFL